MSKGFFATGNPPEELKADIVPADPFAEMAERNAADARADAGTDADADEVLQDEVETTTQAQWEEVYHPHGLVGEVAQWILDSSGVPQPKFALAAALAVCGSLLGRVVKDYTGQRSNLFVLSVIPSSGGKNDPIKFAQKLIHALEMDRLAAARATSDSALEVLVSAYPVRILFLDEVGDYLGSLKSAGQNNPFLQTVIPCIKEMWSCADGIYKGKARALDTNGKWREPKTIKEPHISIYGTGAPSRLFASMTEKDFDEGSIPRFLVFNEETFPRRRDIPAAEVPAGLVKRLREVLSRLGMQFLTVLNENDAACGTHTEFKFPDSPRVLEYTPEARAVMNEFEDFKHSMMVKAADDPFLYLWGKSVENARRVALAIAAFRTDRPSPMVDADDARFAVALVRLTTVDMIRNCRLHVASSEKERDLKKVLRVIRRGGKKGVSLSHITLKTRGMKSQSRYDALDDLCEEGTIVECKRNGTGHKPVTWYVYAAAGKEEQ